MGAISHLRAQRRLSGFVVVALLILGGISAGHHHRLVMPADGAGIAAPASFDPMSRTTECVICRAADPARVVIAEVVAPQVLVTTFIAPALTEHARPALFRVSSPRAPPAAA